ncbi:MAG: TA system VapC family ribonuclease toxin [Actinomycetota bacterium]|nr:TA system VapC family ribonuclease toxin [Actinomycetota bacterium]
MIAVDTNLLVYSHRRDSEFHEAAHASLQQLAESRSSWAIPWPCVHEFLAIVTHARIYDPPTPLEQALAQVEAWLDSPSLVVLSETADYWSELRNTLSNAGVTGAKIHDARVATLCIASGVRTLWTADRDFSRFADLQVQNPLVA